MAFSGISREVLDIAGRLRDELGRPDLAQHLARLQEREQEKLQLVGAGLGGGPWGSAGGGSGGLSSRGVPPQTAQLQLARQQAQDQPEVDAHQQEVRELKHK